MDHIVEILTKYIDETLGVAVIAHEAPDVALHLPFYLTERFGFYRVSVLNTKCLLCLDQSATKLTPDVIEKNIHQIKTKFSEAAVYVAENMTSYDRSRLLKRHVPFIVPGNQMYLPFLGLDLREFYMRNEKPSGQFQSSTQHIFLYLMLHNEMLMPSEVAHRLGYSKMTATRAYREFEKAGVGEVERDGKSKKLSFREPLLLEWEAALPMLKNPVQKRIYIPLDKLDNNMMHMAGESALARISMLKEPKIPTYAIALKEWNRIKENIEEIPYGEDGAIQLELWSHPIVSNQAEQISFLGLYLTLKDELDERVQQALVQAMEAYEW